MIGKLSGRLDSVGEDFIILDVHGVGYVVHCSPRTLSELPRSGDVALAVETQVREDSIRLYGFLRDTERDWFRLLQTVQGVGAKLALAILGTFEPAELGVLIARQDKVAIARAPGVGPRTRRAADFRTQGEGRGVRRGRGECGKQRRARRRGCDRRAR